MIIERFVSQFLILDHEVETNIKALSVEHRLTFNESTGRNLFAYEASSRLHLQQAASVSKTLGLSVSQSLNFTISSAKPRVWFEEVNQLLFIWGEADNSIPPGVYQTLELDQDVVVVKSKGLKHTLTFTDAATFTVSKSLTVSQTLSFSNQATVHKPNKYFTTLPDVPLPSPVTFFLDGVVNEEFKAPILGNGNDLSFLRVNRRTRGGDLIVFRDSDWPKTETLNLTFDFTLEADAIRLMQVIRKTSGRFMYYTDHEGVEWYGVIQNPETQVIQQGRNSYQIQVVFEGDQTE